MYLCINIFFYDKIEKHIYQNGNLYFVVIKTITRIKQLDRTNNSFKLRICYLLNSLVTLYICGQIYKVTCWVISLWTNLSSTLESLFAHLLMLATTLAIYTYRMYRVIGDAFNNCPFSLPLPLSFPIPKSFIKAATLVLVCWISRSDSQLMQGIQVPT